jgi:hypothetical protein
MLARADQIVKRLMTAPGVGVLVGLTCISVIDDAKRFAKSSRNEAGQADRNQEGDRRCRPKVGWYPAPDAVRRYRTDQEHICIDQSATLAERAQEQLR